VNVQQVDAVEPQPVEALLCGLANVRWRKVVGVDLRGHDHVVAVHAGRGDPSPTAVSLSYICAVSTWRYPASRAAATVARHSAGSSSLDVPRPSGSSRGGMGLGTIRGVKRARPSERTAGNRIRGRVRLPTSVFTGLETLDVIWPIESL